MANILTSTQVTDGVELLRRLVDWRKELLERVQLGSVSAGNGADFLYLTPEGLVVVESRPETDYSDRSVTEEITYPSRSMVQRFDLNLDELRKLLRKLQSE